jgi:hypothetical protein
MMEAVRTSETSVIYLTTRQYIAEDFKLNTRRRANLKSHKSNYWNEACCIDVSVSFLSIYPWMIHRPDDTYYVSSAFLFMNCM